MTILPVILSGGAGSRLWPLSTQDKPKQFLPLPGPLTMIQATARRLDAVEKPQQSPIIVANRAHRDLIATQLAEIGVDPTVIFEPVGRNTAPAVALAAHLAQSTGRGDMALLVMPADHVIADSAAFGSAVDAALPLAAEGQLVTFGVVPTMPHTGYGYIKAANSTSISRVEKFVEKPDSATAQQYLATGSYYWNAGIFLFTADTYLQELASLAPDIADLCAKSMRDAPAASVVEPDESLFSRVRAESIDISVMERTKRASVVPLDAGWSDIGSWSALHDIAIHDADGNAMSGDVISLGTKNSAIFANERTVAVLGMDDSIVVETADSVLVTSRDACQGVKKIIGVLQSRDTAVSVQRRQDRFDWGSMQPLDTIAETPIHCVTLKPGGHSSFSACSGARIIGIAGTIAAKGGSFKATVDSQTAVTVPTASRIDLANVGTGAASVFVQGMHSIGVAD